MKLSITSAEFLSDRARRGCNAATVAFYAKLLRWMGEYFAGRAVFDVEAVTPRLLEEYVANLRARPLEQRTGKLSRITVYKWTLSLKTFWAWAAGHGYVQDDPARPLPLKKPPRPIPKALSADQTRKLLSAPMGARERAAISLMVDTGLRIGEACSLDLSDVDHDQGTILIRQGKGGKQRMIVFAASTRAALRAWINVRDSEGPALFVSLRQSRGVPAGNRLCVNSLYRAIKAVAVSAGLASSVSPHRLRHTCATLWLDNGGGLQDISNMLGHEDLATTAIYFSVATATLRNHHRQFSPLENLKL